MRWILIGLLGLTSLGHAQSFETTVNPLPEENFVGPCHYDLTLPAGRRSVRAVWVTFDRGRDIMKFYSDLDVVAFARRHDLALMMPHQPPAENAPGGPEEMDMNPGTVWAERSSRHSTNFPVRARTPNWRQRS